MACQQLDNLDGMEKFLATQILPKFVILLAQKN